jgi:hypothetical protein
MAIRTLAGLVLAALLTTGCDDLAQKKPQTTSATAGGVVQAPVEARTESGADVSAGERSIRLFGRGVSRQRQIRV